MSVSLRSMLVEGPQAPKPKGPYTYANTPRALYNNAKLKKDPSWYTCDSFLSSSKEERKESHGVPTQGPPPR
ncbi:unnamed protein product [Arctia plantaginis]|uniref:Uncharacterized protein n=1 Tax=Arctia plantaginis TaxID=874455 RepID=A0A8S1BM07_ARCPL|nr:unnamed protein product [Arctia plantaginis]